MPRTKIQLTDKAFLFLKDMLAGWIEEILDDPVMEASQFEDIDQAARELGMGGFWKLVEEEDLGTNFEVTRLKKYLSERKKYVYNQWNSK